MERKNIFILLLILLAGFALRLNGIHWGLPSKNLALTTYHPDEAFLFQSLEEMKKTHSLNPGEIGLHYGTLHFYLSGAVLMAAKFLGLIKIGSREFLLAHLSEVDKMYLTIRFMSVLLGVLTIFLTFNLAKTLYNKSTALWAAFFVAMSPVDIMVSHYAKLDAMLPSLTLLLLIQMVRFMDDKSKSNAWLSGILVGLIAGTRYNCGIFIVLPLVIAQWNLRLSARIVIGALTVFLITTPYAVLDFPMFMTGIRHMASFVSSSGRGEFAREWSGTQIILEMIPWSVNVIVSIMFGCWLFKWFFEDYSVSKEGHFLLGSICLFLILLWTATTRYTYYLAPIVPAICVFAAKWFKDFVNGRWIIGISVVIFCLFIAIRFSRLYSAVDTREQAGKWLKESVNRKESVGVVKRYFWTPAILRRKFSPLHVVTAGDDQSKIREAVYAMVGWKNLPTYFVISDLEERLIDMRFREHDESKMTSTQNSFYSFLKQYENVKTFKARNTIFTPWDFATINPTLKIYRSQPERTKKSRL